MSAKACQAVQYDLNRTNVSQLYNIAFLLYFCHAGRVKKYFLLAITFLSLAFFFSLHNVPSVSAWAAEGQFCTIAPLATEENRCDANIHFCNLAEGSGDFSRNPSSNQGICRVKTVLDCQCNGDKGISCGLPGQPKTLPTTCERSEDVCRPAAADFIGPEDRVNRIPLNTPDGGTERLRGISCQNPVFPECTCIGAGNAAASGQNGIQCKVGGVVVGEGFCKDNKACRPGGNLHERDVDRLIDNRGNDGSTPYPNEDRDLRGKDLSGVSCGAEQVQCECSGTPDVAGSGVNSIRCKDANGTVVGEGFCKDNKACVPSGTINENDVDKLQDNLPVNESALNDKDLIGVSCEARQPTEYPTPPPPPPPPCANTDPETGICLAFATGFGELETETGSFIQSLFAILLSLSGGIALLLILKAGYQMMTSQGKPEQLQAGRDQLIAAIVGLVFLIFSFVILQIIGYDILRIPGFE